MSPTGFAVMLLLISPSHSAYFSMFSMQKPAKDPCYNDRGEAQACTPEYINAAFGKPVVASSTCGLSGTPSRYCVTDMDEQGGIVEDCRICDAQRPHPASNLIDLHNNNNFTCWVSEPSTDYPSNVTLTLSLGKKYEITYVSLQFCNQRPDSMIYLKSMDFGRTWHPYQYYSSQCEKFYGKKPNVEISKHNEQEVLCADSHSSLKSGERVAFPTMEGRPSSFDFEFSPVLQDWATATDIRVVFNRPTLEPNDLYGIDGSSEDRNLTDKIRQRYYYSVADFAVGGRCKCNGHGSRCVIDKFGKIVCDCKHNTAGPDCEKCKPFHYDRPWGRATNKDANECVREYKFYLSFIEQNIKEFGGSGGNCKIFPSVDVCFLHFFSSPLAYPKTVSPLKLPYVFVSHFSRLKSVGFRGFLPWRRRSDLLVTPRSAGRGEIFCGVELGIFPPFTPGCRDAKRLINRL